MERSVQDARMHLATMGQEQKLLLADYSMSVDVLQGLR